ncbi:MAG: Hsp20/alpha crystallin family protein [Candidatus Pacebacteria bacterium]|nr:Hsp20/alpha crystallin family protein [Candidatus Paceibacterota bacterium]
MKSFFDKLTASSNNNTEEENDDILDFEPTSENFSPNLEEEEKEGELAIDISDEGDTLILKTMVAGVNPEDLDISISRDSITIRGSRHEEREISKDSYYKQELYWGSFSRTIGLPTEIDIDNSVAIEKNGLLTLNLPKVDKERKSSLKVK